MAIGRPTKLTPEIAEAIEQGVRAGASVGVAARRLGISESAAIEWVRRGEGRDARQSKGLYADFAIRIKQAEAEDEVRRIALIAKAGHGGDVVYRRTTTKADGNVVTEERLLAPEWTANAWHLERKHPDRWGRRERMEVSGKDGGPIQHEVDLRGFTLDELETWRALMSKARAALSPIPMRALPPSTNGNQNGSPG